MYVYLEVNYGTSERVQKRREFIKGLVERCRLTAHDADDTPTPEFFTLLEEHTMPCGVLGGLGGGAVVCSEPLQHVLYKGAHAICSESVKNPAEDLRLLLLACLPYYLDVCGFPPIHPPPIVGTRRQEPISNIKKNKNSEIKNNCG